MLRPVASLSSALSLLLEAHVSEIPIVDDNGSLLDIYSRSDIQDRSTSGGSYGR
jgi:CBS domain-containing protein